MEFSRWSLRLALFVFVLSSLPSIGQETTRSDMASDVELRPVFSDDFSSDSLPDYQVKGEVAWEKGRLKLTDASISRSLEVGSRVKVAVDLEFSTLTRDGEESMMMLELALDGATNCYVGWRQMRAKGQVVSKVEIFDTVPKGGKSSFKRIRVWSDSHPLKSGAWLIDYRYGLLQISHAQQDVLVGFIRNDQATVAGLRWSSYRYPASLRRLAVDGLNRPAPLSEAAQKTTVAAEQQNTQLVQLLRQGKFTEATPLGETVLEIRRKVLGVDHPDYATSLGHLAAVYYLQGDAAKAEPLFLEARDIRKRVLGVEHPDYAMSLNNLAHLYGAHGDAAKAEPLLLEAFDIRKRVLGVEHPDYATSLNNLASFYESLGDTAKAEPLYLEARDIWKRVLGV
ncbi:MAG: hypothetical protein ACI8P0_005931, partial [Planctomycetaceae bacterium]